MNEQNLEDFFVKHAKDLSDNIINSNFINSQDLALKIKVQIKLLLYEFMNFQITNTQEKRTSLINKKQNSNPYYHSQINFEIQKIKSQLKNENILRHNIESNYKYDLLKKFITDKYGEDEMQKFYKSIETEE